MNITKNFTFNVALGEVGAYARTVQDGTGDVVAVVCRNPGTGGDVTDALRDADTLAAVLAIAPEATALPRTTLTGVAKIVDDTGEEARIDANDWSYPNATAGTTTMALLLCYRPTGGSADSAIIPLIGFKYEEVTTGSTLNILAPAEGFWSAGDAPE